MNLFHLITDLFHVISELNHLYLNLYNPLITGI